MTFFHTWKMFSKYPQFYPMRRGKRTANLGVCSYPSSDQSSVFLVFMSNNASRPRCIVSSWRVHCLKSTGIPSSLFLCSKFHPSKRRRVLKNSAFGWGQTSLDNSSRRTCCWLRVRKHGRSVAITTITIKPGNAKPNDGWKSYTNAARGMLYSYIGLHGFT